MITIKVNNQPVEALVDTGSSRSLTTQAMVNKLKLKTFPIDALFMRLGNGSRSMAVEAVKLQVRYRNKYKEQEFLILNSCPYDFVLGEDWLHANKIIIDFSQPTVSVMTCLESPPARIKYRLIQNEIIPAKSFKKVKISCPTESQHCVLAPSILNQDRFHIQIPFCLFAKDEKNESTIGLCNDNDFDIELPKFLALGTEYTDPEDPGSLIYDPRAATSKAKAKIDLNPNLPVALAKKLKKLLDKYFYLFNENRLKGSQAKDVTHRIIINENVSPIKSRPYRVPQSLETEVELQIKEMLQDGIIRPSNSPWSSPIIMVKKKDNSWRFCVDFRRLNEVTKKDQYPLPRVDDLLNKLKGAKFFCTLDLLQGYFQVLMDESSIEKTAFVTSHGQYEFLKLPMGLCNSPSTFQRMMNNIFHCHQLTSKICVYLDDIITFGDTFDEMLDNLEQALKLLSENNLKCKLSKCSFGYESLKFLGHLISADGIAVDPDKTQAVRNFKLPQNQTHVRSFLGLAGYYRRFIKNFAQIAKPLFDIVGAKQRFEWTPKQTEAFATLKDRLTTAPIIKQFDPKFETILYVDSSYLGIGAVLEQIDELGTPFVVEYASRTLRSNEMRYAPTELECLGLIYSIEHFRHYLLGIRFHVDHVTWSLTIMPSCGYNPSLTERVN